MYSRVVQIIDWFQIYRSRKAVYLKICIYLLTVPYIGEQAFAQRSKDGAKVVATANNIVNEYTSLTANAASGATTITVAVSTLNANGRFTGNLAPGDLILLIQIQGTSINGVPNGTIASPQDSTWGAITSYNNCGNWELAEVTSVPNGTSITVDCPLTNSYTAAGRTQIVRIPRYSSLTINNGGVITCTPWNGTIGGICVIEVENNTIINAGGAINTSGNGFRGGALDAVTTFGAYLVSASTSSNDGAEKGEGIAGFQADYDAFGGRYCKSAPANGGGGGNAQNAGGAGGANGGIPASWNGHGMPDVSVGGYVAAWNLQYAGFAAQTSSGGGQGGYSFSGSNNNPTVYGPDNFTIWGGDWRHSCGGFGGRPLDYSTGKLFLGGGGGAGDQNNNEGGTGANGAGLIYLMNYGTVSGSGQFISNGNIGANAPGRDGAGGGGAGGTIIVNSVGAITGVSMTANGGKGGDQVHLFSSTVQAEGPGGGGGGGYIAVSNGTPARTTNGGNHGITNAAGVNPEFPPNGATKGGVGTNAATVTNFIINTANTTICAGQSATLTATLGGNPPIGTTIIWYDAIVAGNVLPSSGGTYTTPVLSIGTYTYYAASCPGTYRQPVVVTVTNTPPVTISPNSTICSGGNTSLNASGGTTYSWSPSTGLNNPNISNPIANPASTTTYVVTVTTACGTGTASVVVTVNSSITATISGNTTICTGGSTTLTASGGGNYSWSTSETTAAIIVSPTANTTYSVNVGSGSCTASASVTVTVSSGITASISPGNTTICPGMQTTLTASGGNNYSWSTGQTTVSINPAPTSTTTYSVTASSGSCSSSTGVTLTVSNNLVAGINGPTTICTGGSATLTGTGGGTYSWSTGQTSASISITPTGTTTYSVLVSSGSCIGTASITVTVGGSISPVIAGNTTLCGGTTSALTASGGSNYSWSTGQSSATISITPLPGTTTNYSVLVSSGSCTGTATISITTRLTLFTYISGNNIICQGDVSTLNATVSNPSSNSFSWNTGATTATVFVSPSVTTTYTVIGFSGACSDTSPVTVTVQPQASATVSPSTTICNGQSTTLSVTSGTSYAWSNGAVTSATTVSPTNNTTYTVTVWNGACKNTGSVSVSVIPTPTVAVSANSTICRGDIVTLNASGGTGYTWSNGANSSSTTVSPSATTTYTVVTSGSGSCAGTGTVTVNVAAPPSAVITGNNNVCQGMIATLTASGGGSYLWSTGETTATINPTISGTYSVEVTIGSCKSTATITTNFVSNPNATVSPDITIPQGQSTNLTASGGATYVWDNGSNGATIAVSPMATTIYCVTVYDVNNCIDTACVRVNVEVCPSTFYLPNAFSPNGDGENDELQIYYGIPECIEKFHLVIYNRWGEKMYETTDAAFKWDGTDNDWILGKSSEGTAVYMYYMNADIANGTKIARKGNISLLK